VNTEDNTRIVQDFIERAFNQGDLSVVDEHLAPDAVDHQEPPGTDFRQHQKAVIIALRTAFPDLHFEIHDILAEGDRVAFRSTMTGTHLGPLSLGPGPTIPATNRAISVAHMHFVRLVGGKGQELWHVWDLAGLMRQLGAAPVQQRAMPQS